ncbi:MAG: UDP-N-acetylmuramoyl-L-alanine--D-glutamate ligase, partial [Muribaculaceae bacterium]|nr:UDP-N-acetylmuramoyl-L-alanine--D-glutamate ligase [Muribaculaceae bacterium]
YINAKFRILQNLTPRDAFIYWQDDPVIRRQMERVTTEARLFPFAEEREENTKAYIDAEDHLFMNTPYGAFTMPRADLALSGLHNLFNSMAAGLSACLLDIRKDDIRRALSDFEGVEHRLEPVAVIDGVRYINDSKATNVNSCWYALESMPGSGVILILGGKDKGNDYSEIMPLVKEKVKAIVAMGVDNSKIVDFFSNEVKVHDTHSLDEAISACRSIAVEGDTVLLSPCCASFDLFSSYEDRGRRFKEAVNNIQSK